jgi:hypothetical protein
VMRLFFCHFPIGSCGFPTHDFADTIESIQRRHSCRKALSATARL